MAKRCVVLPNKRDAGQGRLMTVPADMNEFLKLAGDKLGITAKRVFSEQGTPIDDTNAIREDERVYISSGEAFWKYEDSRVRIYKIAVLGAGGVGKSCISLRYVKNSFVDTYDPTIEDAFRHQTLIDGATCMLDILDTAGQEDMKMLRRQWVQDRDGFLLVYSMTDRRSFDELSSFVSLIRTTKGNKQLPIIVVANKSDLKDRRTITREEGERFASLHNASYMEVSARLGDNVVECFENLIRMWNQIEGISTAPSGTGRKKCTIL